MLLFGTTHLKLGARLEDWRMLEAVDFFKFLEIRNDIMYAVTHTLAIHCWCLYLMVLIFLNDVIYNFNNPGVCKNILFSIFMEDFSTKVASKISRVELPLLLEFVVSPVTKVLLMYKKPEISLNNDFCFRPIWLQHLPPTGQQWNLQRDPNHQVFH